MGYNPQESWLQQLKSDLGGYRRLNEMLHEFWREKQQEVAVSIDESVRRTAEAANATTPALTPTHILIHTGRDNPDTLRILIRFPATAHGSLFIDLYGFFECKLIELCQKHSNGQFQPKRGEPAVDQCCDYLVDRGIKLAGFVGDKQKRDLIRKLRNALAHSAGLVTKKRRNELKNCLGSLAEVDRPPGISVTNGRVTVNHEFDAWFVDELDKVFAGLARAAMDIDYHSIKANW